MSEPKTALWIDSVRANVLTTALRSHRVWLGEQIARFRTNGPALAALSVDAEALDSMLAEIEGPTPVEYAAPAAMATVGMETPKRTRKKTAAPGPSTPAVESAPATSGTPVAAVPDDGSDLA